MAVLMSTNINVLCQSFKELYDLNPLVDLVHIWYVCRYWSHTPANDLKVCHSWNFHVFEVF